MVIMKGFLKKLNVQPTEEILKNPKMKQIVDYVEANDIEIYESEEVINSNAFNVLLTNINSIEALAHILNKSSIVGCINYHAETLAKFYNLYDYTKVEWLGERTRILVDAEYLKYATKEWTEDILFKSNKIIHIGKERLIFKENMDEDLNPIEHNIRVLQEAKERGILSSVISRATQTMKNSI